MALRHYAAAVLARVLLDEHAGGGREAQRLVVVEARVERVDPVPFPQAMLEPVHVGEEAAEIHEYDGRHPRDAAPPAVRAGDPALPHGVNDGPELLRWRA